MRIALCPLLAGSALVLMTACATTAGRATTIEPTASPPALTSGPRPAPSVGMQGPRLERPRGGVVMTIVYDNYAHDKRLRAAWGFSCLVERDDLVLLFDTGGDAATLLSNMSTLGHDPREVDAVVLSHIHGDHVGGLEGVLAANQGVVVYMPRSFPASLKDRVRERARVVEVDGPAEIAVSAHGGIWTTGEMGSTIREQSLVIETPQGLVAITGCAHPGIVDIVANAKEITAEDVYLVMGGFHLSGASREEIVGVVHAFQELGVQKVAPCHCSGDLARELFREAYGRDCILAGVGQILEVGEASPK